MTDDQWRRQKEQAELLLAALQDQAEAAQDCYNIIEALLTKREHKKGRSKRKP